MNGIKQLFLEALNARVCGGHPQAWLEITVDEGSMRSDLLDSGVFGDARMSRKHSSPMTLHAVAANRRCRKAGGNVLRTLFPG